MKSALEALREMRSEQDQIDQAKADPKPATSPTDGPILDIREDWVALRLYSRLLDRELWIARDEAAATTLVSEGTKLPVLLLDEVAELRGKPPELIKAILNVKAAFPGADSRIVS